MRYLVLSDIHSNLEALTAVLQRVRRKRFDRVVILGDLVGYGADPNPIVDRVRKLKRSVIIRGNHDKVCSGIDNGDMFNKIALQSARWTEDQLLPRHRKWLRALPKGPVKVGDVFSISHGTPLDEDAYIFGEIEALNRYCQVDVERANLSRRADVLCSHRTAQVTSCQTMKARSRSSR